MEEFHRSRCRGYKESKEHKRDNGIAKKAKERRETRTGGIPKKEERPRAVNFPLRRINVAGRQPHPQPPTSHVRIMGRIH